MRSLALGFVLLVPAVAAAEVPLYQTSLDARIDDPAKKVTVESLTEAVGTADGTSLDRCWKKPGTMTVKIVFDKGRVAALEASGSGDRDAEACVAKVMRAIALPTSEGWVGATIVLTGTARPQKVGIFTDKNRKALDSILDRNLSTSLGKFTGVSGSKTGSFGTGTGTGVGVGTGTGTGTTLGKGGGGGGIVEGDFVSKGTGVVRPGGMGPAREVKVDVRQPPAGQLNDRTAEEINRVIAARAGIFRACYQKELNRTPDIAGKLVLRFSIEPSGTVSRVQVVAGSTTLASVPVIDCVKNNVLRLKFPERELLSEVTYPFVFSAGK